MNLKQHTNSFVSYKICFFIFVLIIAFSIGLPALLSGVFTIPIIIIIAILYLYLRRMSKSFEGTNGVSISKFYRAVWADKENSTLQEVIDKLNSTEVKNEKNGSRTEEG